MQTDDREQFPREGCCLLTLDFPHYLPSSPRRNCLEEPRLFARLLRHFSVLRRRSFLKQKDCLTLDMTKKSFGIRGGRVDMPQVKIFWKD